LTAEGLEGLRTAVSVQTFVDPEALGSFGIDVAYDPSRLEVLIVSIDPNIAAAVPIIDMGSNERLPVTLEPEATTAYLNLLPDLRLNGDGDVEARVDLFTALRHRNVVLEVDGGYDGGDGIG